MLKGGEGGEGREESEGRVEGEGGEGGVGGDIKMANCISSDELIGCSSSE